MSATVAPEIALAVARREHASPLSDAPLVVDLDGTLVRTNLLLECALAYLKAHPLGILRLLLWLCWGRASLKAELARAVAIDAADLPLNEAVAAFAAAEAQRGRKVYLATAADERLARAVADRCGFFADVLASDGRQNLKGRRKADAIARRLPGPFAYAGDSWADLPVWSRASEIILVGASGATRRAAARLGRPMTVFPASSRLRALVRSARPHQWAKNALVFVPALLAGRLGEPAALGPVIASFCALCLVASATYILNDLWDLADDRRHWSKRARPIASGTLPVSVALGAAPLGLAAGLGLGLLVGPTVALVLAIYVALTLAYSFALKRVPILDVTVLAGLFTLRLALGIAAAVVVVSPWLLAFSMFLFGSLCFAKRHVEIERAVARGLPGAASRGYQARDAGLVFALGCGTGIASIVILVLYVIFDAYQRTFYGNTTWLWAFPVIMFLWFSRIWLMTARGVLDDDPVAFAVGDTPSLGLGVAMGLAFLLAWSGAFA